MEEAVSVEEGVAISPVVVVADSQGAQLDEMLHLQQRGLNLT